MPRLKPVEPDAATGKAKELFEGPLKDKKLNILKSMLNSPAAVEAYLNMSGALGKGVLSEQERETIQLAVGQANGCDYCLGAHTMLAKKAGLSEEDTLAIRKGEGPSDAKLKALTRFTVALNEKKGWVSDKDVEQLRGAGYEDAHLAEIVANCALAVFTNYFNHLNETPLDVPAAPVLA